VGEIVWMICEDGGDPGELWLTLRWIPKYCEPLRPLSWHFLHCFVPRQTVLISWTHRPQSDSPTTLSWASVPVLWPYSVAYSLADDSDIVLELRKQKPLHNTPKRPRLQTGLSPYAYKTRPSQSCPFDQYHCPQHLHTYTIQERKKWKSDTREDLGDTSTTTQKYFMPMLNLRFKSFRDWPAKGSKTQCHYEGSNHRSDAEYAAYNRIHKCL